MKTVVIFLLLCFVILRCSKNSSNEADNIPPVITITNPVNNQIFTAGQSIPIIGSITDNNYIAEVHIHVSNTNNGTLLMDVHKFPAAASVSFNESIIAVAGVNYKIQILATDKKVNQAVQSVNVSSN